MPRIKIEDLPEGMKISPEDMRKITGGFVLIEKPTGDRANRYDVITEPLTINIDYFEEA